MNTYKVVNAIGLEEIRAFLASNHRYGQEITQDMIHAWAADAEFQLSEGNPATIEIRAQDSVTGSTQEYTISKAGLDTRALGD